MFQQHRRFVVYKQQSIQQCTTLDSMQPLWHSTFTTLPHNELVPSHTHIINSTPWMRACLTHIAHTAERRPRFIRTPPLLSCLPPSLPQILYSSLPLSAAHCSLTVCRTKRE